jgi:hypothetical protein
VAHTHSALLPVGARRYEDTPVELEARCRARATQLREAAALLLHMPLKSVRLQAAADELHAEADTWALLWHAFGRGRKEEAAKAAADAEAAAGMGCAGPSLSSTRWGRKEGLEFLVDSAPQAPQP